MAKTTKTTKKAKSGAGKMRSVTAKAKTTAPVRQMPLIPQARHIRLDRLAEDIGADLDTIAQARQDIESNRNAALNYMLQQNIGGYEGNGVRFSLSKGAATLAVKRIKVATSSAVETTTETTADLDAPSASKATH